MNTNDNSNIETVILRVFLIVLLTIESMRLLAEPTRNAVSDWKSVWDKSTKIGCMSNTTGLCSQAMYEQSQSSARQTISTPLQTPPVCRPSPQLALPQSMTITINIQNSNGSLTPVLLRRAGDQWVGQIGIDAGGRVGEE